MPHPMKIAVVGLGDIAEVAYLDNLHKPRKGIHVSHVCDLAPHRLAWAAKMVPSAVPTDSFDDILKDPDVNWVFILTPLLSHAPLVRKALSAGKNVYTEKPLTMDLAEAKKLVALSRRKSLLLASAPVVFLYPVYEYVRSLLLKGALGQVTSARVLAAHGGPDTWPTAGDPGWLFREKTATKIPPLPDMAIYGFSYLAHVFGPALSVTAAAVTSVKSRRFDKVTAPGFKPYTLSPTIRDNCVVTLTFPGLLATVSANFATGGHQPDRFEFYGAEGTLTMPYRGAHVNIQSNIPPHNRPSGLHPLNLRGKTGGKPFSGVNWGPLVAAHLQKALSLGVEPLIGRDFTLHVLEIITSAMTAAETGITQQLKTKFKRDKAWRL